MAEKKYSLANLIFGAIAGAAISAGGVYVAFLEARSGERRMSLEMYQEVERIWNKSESSKMRLAGLKRLYILETQSTKAVIEEAIAAAESVVEVEAADATLQEAIDQAAAAEKELQSLKAAVAEQERVLQAQREVEQAWKAVEYFTDAFEVQRENLEYRAGGLGLEVAD